MSPHLRAWLVATFSRHLSSRPQVDALHAKLLSICREACEMRADYKRFPQEWLFHHRYLSPRPLLASAQALALTIVGIEVRGGVLHQRA